MSVKRICIFIFLCIGSSSIIFSQSRNGSPKQSNKQIKVIKWNDVAINQGGIESISLPANLVEEDDSDSDYEKRWKNTSANSNVNVVEVSVSITIWDDGFKVPDLEPELATPENLLKIDLTGDLNPSSGNIKAMYYKVDGINGELVQRKWATDKGEQMMFIWGTYRYYMKTKAEKIMVSVIVPKTKSQDAMKIIDSLKFEKNSN